MDLLTTSRHMNMTAAKSTDAFHSVVTSSVALYHIRPFLYDRDVIALSQTQQRLHQHCGSHSNNTAPLRRQCHRAAGDVDRATLERRLQTIRQDLSSTDAQSRIDGVSAVEALARCYRVEAPIVRRLIALTHDNADDTDIVHRHVASALESIVECADVDDAVTLISADSLSALLRLLNSQDPYVVASASGALCNLIDWKHHHIVRRAFVQENVLARLLALVHGAKRSWALSAKLRRHIALIQRLCQFQVGATDIDTTTALVVQVIAQETDTAVLTCACEMIPQLIRREGRVCQDIDQNLVPALIRVSHVIPAPPNSRYDHVKLVADVFCSILKQIAGDDQSLNKCKISILCGLRDILSQVLFDDEDFDVKKIVYDAASQVAYSEHNNDVQCLIDAQFFPLFVTALKRSHNELTTNDDIFLCNIGWILTNATDEQDERQVQSIVDCGVIEAIIYSLQHATHSHLIQILLRALQNILECGRDVAANKESTVNVYANILYACRGKDIIKRLTSSTVDAVASNAQDVMSILSNAHTSSDL